MSKLAQPFAKYLIYAKLETSGIVEKPDVIGAIFGQTEGLLGTDMDLRELQRTGRIGRIEVKLKKVNGKSQGTILVPSSLDMSETALIAASLETIDKIGPCDAKITVVKVEDVRSQKRKYVVDRAKEILKTMMDSGLPDSDQLSEEIKQAVRAWEISSYHGLSCGPNIEDYDEIIIVEGRADVINLLKHGVKNVIAIEGSNIPKPIADLCKEKVVTAFLDGDRGGDLNLKKLFEVTEIDYVARAPEGKEVEELTKKEIYKALREKIPADQAKRELSSIGEIKEEEVKKESNFIDVETAKKLKKMLEDIIGTRAVCILDENMNLLGKVPLSQLHEYISNFRNVKGIIVDGAINQELVDFAISRRIKYVIGTRFRERVKSNGTKVMDLRTLEKIIKK